MQALIDQLLAYNKREGIWVGFFCCFFLFCFNSMVKGELAGLFEPGFKFRTE